MNFIRYCDFFDIKFHFYYENRLKISIFGGIMSILCLLGCILTALILSLDDLKKLNPKTTKSEVPGGEFRVVNLEESKIWIPWRLITYEEKFIDHRGILYPMVSLIEGELNDEIGMDLKYHDLKYKLCNETPMANITDIYHIDTPLNELYCIDQSDVLFGGSWLGDNLYYLEVNLFLCEEGIEFNASDSRCTRLNEIVNFTNTTWLFEFYYPVVQFQPTNQEIPLVVIYKNYYYRLSSYTYKLERLYIQENILSDDKSLFSTTYTNTSCWGISTVYGDTYFWQETHDPLVKSNSSCLFSLDIYMDTGRIHYTRSYKKMFEIVSDIFPVLNILIICFEKITIFIKFAFAKKSVIELIFEKNKDNRRKKRMFIKNIKVNDSFKFSKDKLDLSNNLNKLNEINKLNQNLNNINKNNSIHKSDILVNSGNITKACKNSNKSLEKSGLSMNSFYSNKDIKMYKNQYSIGPKKKQKLFPMFYFFMDIIMDKLERPKTFCCVNKKYLIAYNFVGRIFNISSYILLFKYFNLHKNFILKELKNNNININKKINLNDNEVMETIEQNIFSKNFENNEFFLDTLMD